MIHDVTIHDSQKYQYCAFGIMFGWLHQDIPLLAVSGRR
jgi:hypothetical protein